MAGVGSETRAASPGTRGRVTRAHCSLGLSGPVSSYAGRLAPIACLTDCLTRANSSRGSVHGKPVNCYSPRAACVPEITLRVFIGVCLRCVGLSSH